MKAVGIRVLLILSFLYLISASQLSNKWAVKISNGDPDQVAKDLGLVNKGQIFPGAQTQEVKQYYLFEKQDLAALSKKRSIEEVIQIQNVGENLNLHPSVELVQHQVYVKRVPKRFSPPSDPLYANQWHINPSYQPTPNLSINTTINVNVYPVWNRGYFGRGVVIAIIDDALQYDHSDLSQQYLPNSSYNFLDPDRNPTPYPAAGESHGTSCAGVAAARNNSVCGVGAAYLANLSGLRAVGRGQTDAVEAMAASYALQVNDIYSNSWGPGDEGVRISFAGLLWQKTVHYNVRYGRKGLGTVIVWAAGNGRENNDESNYDSYANNPYVITVAAVGYNGRFADYSEPGANVFVSAPSSDSAGSPVLGITTTDFSVTNDDCKNTFGGTSSATPLVSGVIALMLEANPRLLWIDVKSILALTSTVNDPNDPDWTKNGAGYSINHNYGFGLVNADAAVQLALKWNTSVNNQLYSIDPKLTNTVVVNNVLPVGQPILSTLYVDDDIDLGVVGINVNISYTNGAALSIVLESPLGTKSILANPRNRTLMNVTLINRANNESNTLIATPYNPVNISSYAQIYGSAAPVDSSEACSNDITADLNGRIAVLPYVEICPLATQLLAIQNAGAIGAYVIGPSSSRTVDDDAYKVGLYSSSASRALLPNFFVATDFENTNDEDVSLYTFDIVIEVIPLAETRNNVYSNWRFSTVRNWGESSKGTWKLTVTNTFSSAAATGGFDSWNLEMYSRSSGKARATVCRRRRAGRR